jgi:asparagine synthase (glutamine-hydrolysing)
MGRAILNRRITKDHRIYLRLLRVQSSLFAAGYTSREILFLRKTHGFRLDPMCGIMASLDWTGNSSLYPIQDGLEVLHHRGPDGTRLWRSADGHVCLGHVRLSVVDLAAGSQPLVNETSHIHIVVNGEFYDFEQIRAELETRGHHFGSRSDSEILLHLYEEFGTDCVHYLRGEYAFVLWDERAKVLFAARDRFGIKPLFFSESHRQLLFASEIKALHAAGIPSSWDEQGFFEKLALDLPLHGRTLFRHISELPPAHYLIAQNEQFTIHRYWDFNYPREHEVSAAYSDDEYAHQLQTVLDRAVRARLRADVPIACYLSGGIDSSSVLGLMSRHCSRPIEAFCLAFDDVAYDESPLARETAGLLNARFSPVPVTQASLAANFGEAVWHGETLFTNAQGVAKLVLSAAVRKAGYKVVLTGEGADEIFAGYPVFVVDEVRHGNKADRHASRQSVDGSDISRLNQTTNDSARPRSFLDRLRYVPAWYEAREIFLEPLRDVLPAHFQSEELHGRLLDGFDLENQLHDRSILDQSLYLYNKTTLPGHILTVMGDRMEMAHSVEARLPFLDHHVVDFSRHLPRCQKIRGFAEKFALRKAMRLVVPPAVCGRRKRALQAPPSLLEAGPMHDLMQDTLRGRSISSIPFLSKGAAVRLLDRAMASDSIGKTALESPLMALLSACVLSDKFHL